MSRSKPKNSDATSSGSRIIDRQPSCTSNNNISPAALSARLPREIHICLDSSLDSEQRSTSTNMATRESNSTGSSISSLRYEMSCTGIQQEGHVSVDRSLNRNFKRHHAQDLGFDATDVDCVRMSSNVRYKTVGDQSKSYESYTINKPRRYRQNNTHRATRRSRDLRTAYSDEEWQAGVRKDEYYQHGDAYSKTRQSTRVVRNHGNRPSNQPSASQLPPVDRFRHSNSREGYGSSQSAAPHTKPAIGRAVPHSSTIRSLGGYPLPDTLDSGKSSKSSDYSSSESRPGAHRMAGPPPDYSGKDAAHRKGDHQIPPQYYTVASLRHWRGKEEKNTGLRRSRHSQRPPHVAPAPSAEQQLQPIFVEIMPGVKAQLRRTEETRRAVANDFLTPVSCRFCDQYLFCVADLCYFACPKCEGISSLDNEHGDRFEGRPIHRHGLGVGFTVDTLFRMQSNVYHSSTSGADS